MLVPHQAQDRIAAPDGPVRMVDRGVACRGRQQACKQSGFINGQVPGFFAEKSFGGSLHTIGSMAKMHCIEIHFKDLFLGIGSLDLDCGNDFLDLAEKTVFKAHGFIQIPC